MNNKSVTTILWPENKWIADFSLPILMKKKNSFHAQYQSGVIYCGAPPPNRQMLKLLEKTRNPIEYFLHFKVNFLSSPQSYVSVSECHFHRQSPQIWQYILFLKRFSCCFKRGPNSIFFSIPFWTQLPLILTWWTCEFDWQSWDSQNICRNIETWSQTLINPKNFIEPEAKYGRKKTRLLLNFSIISEILLLLIYDTVKTFNLETMFHLVLASLFHSDRSSIISIYQLAMITSIYFKATNIIFCHFG